ncbi:extensin [Streptomyces sp. NPDC050085]|uniref:extensin n=1 Tax=Streptomyces sp. NPDC050085 TaxID=3365600 RepID=UPI0037A9BBE4
MRAAPAQAEALLTWLTRVLVGVAVLTFAFTEVNVTLFATSRGVPWPIAILLDPMVGLALAGVLYADARLAAWGLRPPGWSAALRWFTALAATAMNTWTSVWPTGVIGWPRHAEPAGIVLHGIPTVMLVLLTEAIAAYRRAITPLLTAPSSPAPNTQPVEPTDTESRIVRSRPTAPAAVDTRNSALEQTDRGRALPSAHPASADRPGRESHSHSPTAPIPVPHGHLPAASATTTASNGRGPVHVPGTPPAASAATSGPHSLRDGADTAADDPDLAALRERARQLDSDVRAETGQGASTWRLRTQLRIGLPRARDLFAELNPDTDEITDPR